MTDRQKILIYPTNLNPFNKVANYGVHLAKQMNLPAVIADYEMVPTSAAPAAILGTGLGTLEYSDMSAVEERATNKVELMSQFAKTLHENIDYEVEIGFPEVKLAEKSEENIMFMIIGQQSSATTFNKWLGTFETRVAENTACPVLVVAEEVTWQPVSQLLYIMEENDHDVAPIRQLAMISKKLDANLTVVNLVKSVEHQQQETLTEMLHTVKKETGYKRIYHYLSHLGTSDADIRKMMMGIGANWLAFQRKDQSYLEQIFSITDANRLILESEFPVLVL